MTGGIPRAAAEGFARVAELYERVRPSYPLEAVDAVVERLGIGPGSRVLDLAAGTGKFTRLLVDRGADVIALEPVAEMRIELRATVRGAEVLAGTAESIPLADGSIDAVTVAQAFHWFDQPRALAEIRRVLRPSGGLAIVWNLRDESEPWVAEFGARQLLPGMRRPYEYPTPAGLATLVADVGGFSPLDRVTFRFPVPCTPSELVERAASVSFVAAMPPDERQVVLDRIADLAATHPSLAGREEFVFPYITSVYWCWRR